MKQVKEPLQAALKYNVQSRPRESCVSVLCNFAWQWNCERLQWWMNRTDLSNPNSGRDIAHLAWKVNEFPFPVGLLATRWLQTLTFLPADRQFGPGGRFRRHRRHHNFGHVWFYAPYLILSHDHKLCLKKSRENLHQWRAFWWGLILWCRVGQDVEAIATFLAKANGVIAGLAVADLVRPSIAFLLTPMGLIKGEPPPEQSVQPCRVLAFQERYAILSWGRHCGIYWQSIWKLGSKASCNGIAMINILRMGLQWSTY